MIDDVRELLVGACSPEFSVLTAIRRATVSSDGDGADHRRDGRFDQQRDTGVISGIRDVGALLGVLLMLSAGNGTDTGAPDVLSKVRQGSTSK
ncbi:hypothetical protein GCM10023322_79220 [Rugosimonospora acidiphila]|uniref:Uncharacterized protein n=1 Tax=Rugosimonospora acidiphila TaxID=556531 RepID=A0ABP9SSN9_9ACTN